MRLISSASARASLVMILGMTTAACGGGGASQTASDNLPSASKPTPDLPAPGPADQVIENQLTGSVGDGPLIGATILVFNVSGGLLAELVSDDRGSYEVSVREKGREYPLTVYADGGTDLVTGHPADFSMSAAIVRPARTSRGNINPHGTLIVETASRMPGGVSTNMDSTRAIVLDHLNFGLDPAAVPDPLATDISDANIAILVKASEALGEMVRRTRDARGSVEGETGNFVMAALAADLTDGRLDGRGAAGTDARVAAIANVVSAQVLVEALQNGIYVNGAFATQQIDDAIRIVRPGIPDTAISESVTANAQMLAQARLAVDAARVVSESAVLADLRAFLDNLQPGTRPADVRGRLPAGWREELAVTIQRVAFGSAHDIETVNALVRAGGLTGAGDQQDPARVSFPVSSHQIAEGGQTAVLVQRTDGISPAWVDYEFVPGTAAPNEDFIAAPGRLNFGDGQVSGTIVVESLQDTVAEDPETFEVHLVAASDNISLGTGTVAVITVADDDSPAPTVGSATLRWTPPTEREDGSALTNLAGYKVMYGLDQANLDNVTVLANPGLTTYVVEDLHPGTWYFALTAFDSDGRESTYSNVGSKMIM